MMKSNVFLLAMMMSGSLTASVQQGGYSLDFAIDCENFVDSIAIEWVDGRVYVPVSVGGRACRFLLDTGAGQTVVYSDTPMAQCPRVGTIESHDAVGRTTRVDMVQLPPMTVGQTTFIGCSAVVQQRVASRLNIDGIIGFDIVNKGLSMKIDVQSRQLVLTDRKRYFDNEPGVMMRYKLNYHVPYIEVSPFDAFTERVLVDTGSRSFYSINKKQYDAGLKKRSEKRRLAGDLTEEGRSVGYYAMGYSGAEENGEVVFLQLDNMKMGSQVFTNVHTLTTQGGSHLGAALLHYGMLTFMPRKKQVLFQPYTLGDTCTVGNRQLEIAFVQDDGRPVVGLVWEQSEPYRQGFRQGDIIVKIDGREVNSFQQFMNWGYERGREYEFTVLGSDGQERQLKWVRLKKRMINTDEQQS